MDRTPSRLNALFSELRRRHVFKVAAAYGVVAWLLIQVAATVSPLLDLPAWVPKLVLLLLLLGFPVAVVLAWAFELTPDGFRRTEPLPDAAEPSGPRQRPFDNRAAGWAGVGILVGLVSVGAYGWMHLPEPTAGVGGAPVRSLAVLPFAGVGGGESDYFSEGISEELLNTLSRVPQLQVAARTSSFSFQGREVGLDSVARALKVDHLLEGSVRAAGDRVRISARLVDGATGRQVWSQSYDRGLRDVLAVQEEIAVAIANALQVKLAGGNSARLARSRTPDPEAYELYLQGRQLVAQRTKEDLQQAVLRFQAAVERDPAFAAAYSGLADAYALSEDYKGLPREEAFPKAIAAAQRALELDELQAEAHASMGHIHYHQREWAASERALRRALELNPSYATAHHWYANLLVLTSRVQEALRASERAYRLDPLSPTIEAQYGWKLYLARQHDRAIAWRREKVRARPDDAGSHAELGRVYLSQGNYAEAIASLERAVELVPAGQPNAWARAQLAGAYAAARRREEAARMLRELEPIAAEQGATVTMASAYGYLGDPDRAFRWLDVAFERGSPLLWSLGVIPMLDPLRSDPRFATYVERAGKLGL